MGGKLTDLDRLIENYRLFNKMHLEITLSTVRAVWDSQQYSIKDMMDTLGLSQKNILNIVGLTYEQAKLKGFYLPENEQGQRL